MKWANLLKVALVAFILILVISNCKKENDFAKQFVGNYKGVMTEYVGTTSTVKRTYPNTTVTISEVDRNTIAVKIFADSLQNSGEAKYTVNGSNGFSNSSNVRGIFSASSGGTLSGDSLTYGYHCDGTCPGNNTEFKGVRF